MQKIIQYVSEPMSKTTIFVRCKDDDHRNDAKFSHVLLRIPGVSDVIETFVRDTKGKDYCMIVETHEDKKGVARVSALLRKHENVGSVHIPKPAQVPI
ncbi:MAG TPA: hypothetical protein VND15_01905 [Candidatus Acidoferrales bacterium]|nr:hypothetical protein [Candidatus Acidoferrales bacterium]